MKIFLHSNMFSKLKFIYIILITLLFNLFDIQLKAHYRGYYSTEIEAKEKAREIGCIGAFKLKKLWMPCQNEKEFHQYLRKKS